MHSNSKLVMAPPRYLRASLGAVLVASVLPLAILGIGYWSIIDGPPVAASEAQGAFIIAVHIFVALPYVALFYPFLAMSLYRKGTFNRSSFYGASLVSIVGASLLPCFVLGAFGFGGGGVVLFPVSFVILLVLVLPARSVWWKLSQY